MPKRRYEEMRPHEIVAERRKNAIAYLPIGGLEWHGEHLAVGNDTVKAHALCLLAAERSGGLVMPALFWGEVREGMELMETGHDPGDRIKEKMQLPRENFRAGYMGRSVEEMAESYDRLLLHIYRQLESLGFKVIIVVAGHYPLLNYARRTAEQFNAERPARVFACIGFDLVTDLGYRGDHAAKWETSLLWALRPELVDMSRLPADPSQPLIGVGGVDPRKEASAGFGWTAAGHVADRMAAKARELLAEVEGEASS
jgi:creatinine amidohydrolase